MLNYQTTTMADEETKEQTMVRREDMNDSLPLYRQLHFMINFVVCALFLDVVILRPMLLMIA